MRRHPLLSTPMSSVHFLFGFGLVLGFITLSQWSQNPWSAWKIRPSVTCEQGEAVHRTGHISTDRVNVRSLPTVFSDVLGQVGENYPVTVVCQFGSWSQVDEPKLGEVAWISSGLILLDDTIPLSWASRLGLILGILASIGLMTLAYLQPRRIQDSIHWLLQTGDLPDYAKPLISNPKKGSTRP